MIVTPRPPSGRVLFLFGALLLGGSAAFAQDVSRLDETMGPLEIRNMRSVSMPFLRIDLREPVLAKGVSDVHVAFQAANDMRLLERGPKTDFEDYEMDRVQLRYRKGFGNGSDLTVEVQLLDRNGGFMDPIINFWHKDVLHIHVPLRENTPYGRSVVDIPGHREYNTALGLGDTSIYWAKQLSGRVTAIAGAGLPTGRAAQLLGGGAINFGLSAQYRTVVNNKLVAYAHAGCIYQGPDPELPEARRLVHQEGLSLVWSRNSRDAVIGQWDSEASAIVTGIPGSDSGHRMVSLGFRRSLTKSRWLEMYFSEDGDWLNYRADPFVNIAPDFTVGFVVGSRF